MQLKIQCSCGSNTYWNGENNHMELEFAKHIHETFMREHQGHGNIRVNADQRVFNQTLEVEDEPRETEFITRDEMEIDQNGNLRHRDDDELDFETAHRDQDTDLIRELENL